MKAGSVRTGCVVLAMLAAGVAGCARWRSAGSGIPRPARDTYRRIDLPPERYASAQAARASTLATTGGLASPSAFSALIPAPEEMPIDLPTVLRLAGTDALEVQLAREKLREAYGRRLAADFQFLPTIQPGWLKQWHRGRTQAVDGTFLDVDKQSSLLGVGATVEWDLGEQVFESLAARRRVEAGEAGVGASRDEARLRAVNAFFDLILAHANLAISRDRLKQADETVRIAELLRGTGAGLLSEVKRAQAARAAVRQRVAAAEDKVRVVSLDLTEALHMAPLLVLVPAQEPQDMLALVPPERGLIELASDALARRPELAESRALWAALDQERKAALLGPLIPTVKGGAFGGSLGPDAASGRSTQDYALGLQWKVGPGGIGDVSRLRIAKARQSQEGVRFAQLADRVVREVVENQTHVETARKQIESSKEEVAAATETLRLTRARMRNGAALTIEVLDAEDALFGAQLHVAQNIAEFNKAEYALLRSIGGWREETGLPGN